MTAIDLLTTEFDHEAQTTRKLLERLPNDRLDWRPHEKSFTARALASHIVECVRWTESIFSIDEFDFQPATHQHYLATSVTDLLQAFDGSVASGREAMARVADAALMQPWRLKMKGRLRFERPRMVVFRDFTLSHVIHHRGQLSVYLRLLGVPVPGSYGPTADEPM
jgi:uncharacterized damage-inducible protein DinB